eukprot:scaffold119047_cov37-Tisochrysis_lutea.AAC.1
MSCAQQPTAVHSMPAARASKHALERLTRQAGVVSGMAWVTRRMRHACGREIGGSAVAAPVAGKDRGRCVWWRRSSSRSVRKRREIGWEGGGGRRLGSGRAARAPVHQAAWPGGCVMAAGVEVPPPAAVRTHSPSSMASCSSSPASPPPVPEHIVG